MRKRRGAAALLAGTATGLVLASSALAFGAFGSPTSIAVDKAYQVTLGDLNGDGRMDLAASSDPEFGDGGFIYALGLGDGSFKPAQSVPLGTDATEGVAIGNFNGDRRGDLAISDYIQSSVSFLFTGKGGSFTIGPTVPSGNGAFLLKTGDFNEDGRTDVVSCNYASTGPAAISVLLQKRKRGGFKAHRDFSGVSDCGGIDVGRLNDDKHLDVVEQSYDGPFAVFLGRGDGTFKAHQDHIATPSSAYGNVSIGDFTGDGRNDVAAASYDEQKVLVYPGRANGVLKPPKTTNVLDAGPEGIEAADYNRDGKLDLAIASYDPEQLTVLIGKGNGRFKQAARTAPQSDYSLSITSGRLNHDKAPDIVVGTHTTADVYINSNR